MRRLLLVLAGCAFLCACERDRGRELEAELAKLSTERVEHAAVASARSEADAEERAVDAARARLEAVRGELAGLDERRKAAAAALERELARAAATREPGLAAREAEQLDREASQRLDGEIAAAREQARRARDAAAAFAREIRASDPGWATERRIASLRELFARVGQNYPDDPVIARLSADLAGAPAAAGAAAALRDRLTSVYGLPPPP